MESLINLIGEKDATIWAKRWLETISENPDIPTDESTMIGWFANAIMTGYDLGRHDAKKQNVVEQLRELIYQAVGAGTGVLLQDHPDYIFPSERVREAVENICTEFGIPKVEGY